MPNETDDDLWRRVTRGVKPIRRPSDRAREGSSEPPSPEPAAGTPGRRKALAPSAPAARPVGPGFVPPARPAAEELDIGVAPGLDKRSVQRLRRGLIRPESQIDLHNMTQAQAHGALVGFIAASQMAGRRCVLVITGKGYGSDGMVGVLKASVPRWLNEPACRERVLAFAHATPGDGGDGALYVLLRRLRRA